MLLVSYDVHCTKSPVQVVARRRCTGGEEGRGGVLGKLLPGGRRNTRSGEEKIRRDTGRLGYRAELSDKETSD